MTAWAAGEDKIKKKKMTSAFVKTGGRGGEGYESQLFECSKRKDRGENK